MTVCSIFILPRDLRANVISIANLLLKDRFLGVVLLKVIFLPLYNSRCLADPSVIYTQFNGICVDNTLLMADDMSEGLFYADFDLSAIRKYRESEMLGNTYRKVKAYEPLLFGKITYPFLRENQSPID